MTTERKVLFVILGVAAISFATIRGPVIYKAKAKENKEYGHAIKSLGKNSKALESAGYVMLPSSEFGGEEISSYDRAIESQPEINAAVASRDGNQMMQAISSRPEALKEVLSKIPTDEMSPLVEKDVLQIARSRTTSIFLDGLDQYARQMVTKGNLAEARKAMEVSATFMQLIKTDNEQMTLAVQFGSSVDLLERLHSVIIHPKATKEDVQWVKDLVSTYQHQITLSDYIANQVFERVQAMENRKDYDDDEWQTVNIEGYNEYFIAVTPSFIKANKSRLYEFLLEAIKIDGENKSKEDAGGKIDLHLSKIQHSAEGFHGDSYFMVRTLGATYELIGRNVDRVHQGLQGLELLADYRLAKMDGRAPAKADLAKFGYQVTPNGRNLLLHFREGKDMKNTVPAVVGQSGIRFQIP